MREGSADEVVSTLRISGGKRGENSTEEPLNTEEDKLVVSVPDECWSWLKRSIFLQN